MTQSTSNDAVMETRGNCLFRPFSNLITDRKVLELAPFEGWFTQVLLDANPREIHVVELSPSSIEIIRSRFAREIASRSLFVHHADVHLKIYDFTPLQFDTVICSGFLYHTPHTLWVLEGIARLLPEYIFVESFDGPSFDLLPEILNQPGMRQSVHKCVPVHLMVPKETLLDWMKHLGYEIYIEIDKSTIPLPDTAKVDEYLSNYFDLWIKQYSIWFQKVQVEQV